MGVDFHLLADNHSEPVVIGKRVGVSNAGGGSPNAAVTTSVSFTDRFGNGRLPTLNYAVCVTPSQLCSVAITAKTNAGFNVVLTPPSGGTLAAGTFDVIVVG
jgi:hypothetical protein